MPRGGARKGAGGPKKTRIYSDAVKKDFLRAAKKKAKETGKTLGDIVMEIAYGQYHQDSVRIAAVKCFNDVMVVKESVRVVEALPGVIELPKMADDPAVEEAKVSIQ
jgi:hypothetical protein